MYMAKRPVTHFLNVVLLSASGLYSDSSICLYLNGMRTGAPSKLVRRSGYKYVSCKNVSTSSKSAPSRATSTHSELMAILVIKHSFTLRVIKRIPRCCDIYVQSRHRVDPTRVNDIQLVILVSMQEMWVDLEQVVVICRHVVVGSEEEHVWFGDHEVCVWIPWHYLCCLSESSREEGGKKTCMFPPPPSKESSVHEPC